MNIKTRLNKAYATLPASFRLLVSGLMICIATPALSQNELIKPVAMATTAIPKELQYPELVKKFYERNDHKIFWLQPGEEAKDKRAALQLLFDSSSTLGLNQARYNRSVKLNSYAFTNISGVSGQELLTADMVITDAALSFCKDLYQGAMMHQWISYDELSVKNIVADNDKVVNGLLQVKNSAGLLSFARNLEPQEQEYARLKTALHDETARGNRMKIKQLSSTINFYRWVHHFQLQEFIVVNIGAATLRYYHRDTVMLTMKAVVGTPHSRTPRFAAYCNEIVLYPYWNVPRSIALNEMLPKFKRSHAQFSFLNMEILDRKGKIIPPEKIPWKSLSRSNFPYRFREKTGCINPLGVVKFNITDPYSIYLHDTNFKNAFLAKSRYYSHGCIRIEDPVSLANALLDKPVDAAYLLACYKDLKPVTMKVPRPVPVFTVYMTAEADTNGTLQYFKDVYGLLK